MATIEIFEMHPAGSELFHDSESFLDELRDSHADSVKGGCYNLGFEKNGQTIISVQSNSFNNNTINGQSINAVSVTNYNSVVIYSNPQ